MEMEQQSKILKLSHEGMLVKCKTEFGAWKVGTDSTSANRYSTNRFNRATKIKTREALINFNKGDHLLYLGCRLYPNKYSNRSVDRHSINYTISLRFLAVEIICKVDQFGISKLECLKNASFFMYKHFSLGI